MEERANITFSLDHLLTINDGKSFVGLVLLVHLKKSNYQNVFLFVLNLCVSINKSVFSNWGKFQLLLAYLFLIPFNRAAYKTSFVYMLRNMSTYVYVVAKVYWRIKYTLASKFGANVYISPKLQTWRLK